MKKLMFYLLNLLLVVALLSCGTRSGMNTQTAQIETASSETVLSEEKVPLADPYILLYNGIYYAYGTFAEDGIAVMTSEDLLRWTPAVGRAAGGLALYKEDVWGEKWFWAPEVYRIGNKFYMLYSADEHICIAESDSPLGPFVQQQKQPLIKDERCIDNTLFTDDDGKLYMFFCRFNDGLNIWVAEMEADLSGLKMETLRKCIHVSQPWEEIWPRVNEGSFVIKHNGTYYMTYSANSYESPFYGIGCATSSSVWGPWTKYDHNPLLQKPGDLVGVGHSAMFTDKSGKLRIVFHAHCDEQKIHPRHMYISDVSFRFHDGSYQMVIDSEYLVPHLEK